MYFLLSTSEKKNKRERFKDSRCTKQGHFYCHKAGVRLQTNNSFRKGLAEAPPTLSVAKRYKMGKLAFWGFQASVGFLEQEVEGK